jgi:uncharacterized protein YeaO (DUF488 family)
MGRIPAGKVRLKRAYDRPNADDGRRILVDRLWPRGLSKNAAAIDEWARELAPSTRLRKWFGHEPARWEAFRCRYAREIRDHAEDLARLRSLARSRPITLIYSARDEVHNDAVVLRDVVLGRSIK